jgi:hypothetical protein
MQLLSLFLTSKVQVPAASSTLTRKGTVFFYFLALSCAFGKQLKEKLRITKSENSEEKKLLEIIALVQL